MRSTCVAERQHRLVRAELFRPRPGLVAKRPNPCIRSNRHGNPDPKRVSTSFAERQNWTARTNMRRYTPLFNGFSRKIQNHEAAVALNYFAYKFIRIHRTLRVRPAMAAGVSDRLWDVADLVALWEMYERRTERAA